MPRKRLLSLLCAVVMACLMVVAGQPAVAEPAEPGIAWSRSLGGNTYPEILQTDLDGKVRVSSCYPVSGYQNISVKLHESGASTYDGVIPVDPSVQPQACSGEASSVVDGSGNWFTAVRVFSGGGWTHKIASYGQNEQLRWSINLPGCSRSTYIRLYVGSEGVIYGAATCQWGTNSLFALTADANPATGAPTLLFQKHLYMQWLFGVFNDGIIVAGNGRLEYLDLQGDALQPVIGAPSSSSGSFWEGASTQGRIFFLHNASQNQINNCGADATNANGNISAYSKTGEAWKFEIDDCLSIRRMYPTPDGGVVALGRVFSNQGWQAWRILSLDSAGNLRWTKEVETYTTDYLLPMAVTLSGDVVLHYPYSEAPGSASRSVVISVFSSGYGEEVFRKVLEGTSSFAPTNNYSVALAKGRLYIGVGKCEAQCGWPVTNPQVYALDIPRLESAYPEAALLGASASPRSKYAGLGDSFISGLGAGDIIPSTEGDQGCNRSANAYPRILDRNASLNLSLQAFVACSGATTQQIIDGKSGEPSQLAVLSDEIEVITLMGGGNDIDFVRLATDCLKASCAVGSAAHTASVHKLVYELPGNLHNLYQAIHEAAPNATVYVVLYPPILPEDNFTNPCTFPPHPAIELSIDEVDYEGATSLLDGLNDTIIDEVEEMSVITGGKFKVVDASVQYFGHELCRDGGFEEYFNGPMLPERDSLHPKAAGHEAFAYAIANEMN